jgi:hypothetical protein
VVATFWEPLTAIGTLTLAAFTAYLALSTRRLARNAGDEVRANWRPVLVIQANYSSVGGTPSVRLHERELWLNVRNVGRGPALHVRATLDLDQDERAAQAWSEILAPDEFTALSWPEFEPPPLDPTPAAWKSSPVFGRIECEDVSSAKYITYFNIRFGPDGLKIGDLYVKSDPILLLLPGNWFWRFRVFVGKAPSVVKARMARLREPDRL